MATGIVAGLIRAIVTILIVTLINFFNCKNIYPEWIASAMS